MRNVSTLNLVGGQNMKMILTGLLAVFGFTTTIASADFLGETDDAYIGFQMTTPLGIKSTGLFSGRSQYSYLLLRQQDGVRDGVAIMQDGDGNHSLNYLRPSASFDISLDRLAEHAVPVMRLRTTDSAQTNGSANAAGVGLAAILVVALIARNDLEKKWKPADPD